MITPILDSPPIILPLRINTHILNRLKYSSYIKEYRLRCLDYDSRVAGEDLTDRCRSELCELMDYSLSLLVFWLSESDPTLL